CARPRGSSKVRPQSWCCQAWAAPRQTETSGRSRPRARMPPRPARPPARQAGRLGAASRVGLPRLKRADLAARVLHLELDLGVADAIHHDGALALPARSSRMCRQNREQVLRCSGTQQDDLVERGERSALFRGSFAPWIVDAASTFVARRLARSLALVIDAHVHETVAVGIDAVDDAVAIRVDAFAPGLPSTIVLLNL